MDKNKVYELDVDDILPNRFQPRINFGEKQINELAESIREHGVINPIVVRKISDKFEIISGERRYKACIIANKNTIPAIIVDLNDREAAEVAIIENVQRQDLTPIEEAVSYRKILDMGMTQESLAKKLGKNQSTVANKLRLLHLTEDVQEALLYHKISERHARSLLKLNSEGQKIILKRILNERLTVRKTDQAIYDYILKKKEENKINVDLSNIKDRKINKKTIIKTKDGKIKEENIEILDFDIEKKGEKEDMNNNIIPNTDIINDTTTEQQPVVNDYNSTTNSDFNVINPGFMDVDKIENQAQDIYVDKKPSVDMETLLHPDENAPKPIEEKEKIEVEEELPAGKFFNIMPEEEPKDNGFVSNIEDAKTNVDFIPQEEQHQPINNSFNFDSFFDSSFQPFKTEDITTEKAKQDNSQTVTQSLSDNSLNQNSTVDNLSSQTINSVNSTNSNSFFVPTESNVEQVQNIERISSQSSEIMPPETENKEQNINSLFSTTSESIPVFENNNPVVNDSQNNLDTTISNNVENSIDNIMPNVISNNQIFESNSQLNNLNSSSTIQSTVTSPFAQEYQNVSPFQEQNSSVQQAQSIETPTIDLQANNSSSLIEHPTIEKDLDSSNFDNQDTGNINQPNQVEINPQLQQLKDLGVSNEFMNFAETKSEQPVQQREQIDNKQNIKKAIDMVRSCSDAIGTLGFKIDIEEYDLENMYEFIIKVEK